MKRIVSFLLAVVLVLTSLVSFAMAEEKKEYKLGERTLSQSMTGADVLEAQKRLAELKYYLGAQDGIFGSGMLAAVYNFQRKNSLKVDGKIGADTLSKLQSASAIAADTVVEDKNAVLRPGASGEQVKELQRQLRETYYYNGKIDGVYGSSVTSAVREFQQSAGLKADGKAGPATREALYNRKAAIFNGGLPIRLLDSGCRGYDVYVLQQKLVSLNFLSMTPSGYYGTDTVNAVKALEKANGLKETGKTGSIVRRYLWPAEVDKAEREANANKGTTDDPYTDRTLRKGSHGDDVANMQMRLKAACYLYGKADGVFGLQTEEAVKALQKDFGLKQDGVVGAETWKVVKALNVKNAEMEVVDKNKPAVSTPTEKMKRGSKGAMVKKLQQALIALKFLASGEDDGVFGMRTSTAVKAFQKANGLTVDGVVGTKTMVKLQEVLGTQYAALFGAE